MIVDQVIGAEGICQVIPHRPPFLLVDTIIQNIPGKQAIASYKVKNDNPLLAGHFPGNPIFPGVLITEHMAQVSCYLIGSEFHDRNKEYLLVRINKCQFSGKVTPDDELITTVEITRRFDDMAFFSCESVKNGELIAKAELLVSFKDRIEKSVESGL